MEGISLTPEQEKINALKQIIPEAFSEGKIDWEKLKATLGEDINFSNERYVLNWAGKSDAFKILQTPTTRTLIPVIDESVNFDITGNIFIEGENLSVLKILQKSYFGKVKMIYIDPPYNTGKDSFIYPDKFSESKAEYEKRVGDKDEEGYMTKDGMFKRNSKENGQYHSNWLNMMMPRLYLAKNLLRQDGVIFVSIDDNEVHNLRLLMNEIFGEENFISLFVRRQNLAGKQDAKKIAIEHDYVLLYSKSFDENNIIKKDASLEHYKYADEHIETRGNFYLRRLDDDGIKYSDKLNYPIKFLKGESVLIFENEEFKNEILSENLIIYPNNDEGNNSFNWRWSKKKIEWGKKNEIIVLRKNSLNKWQVTFKSYALVDNKLKPIRRENPYGSFILDTPNNLAHYRVKELFNNNKYFKYPKPIDLIKRLIKIGSNKDDIILDFFAGSGTTAHAVMELNKEDGGNRKYICVQLPELCDENSEAYKAGYKTIADICKERIRRAGKRIKDEIISEINENESKIKKLQIKSDDKDNKEEIENLKFKIENLKTQDLGFKVFKENDSNFKQWQQIENHDSKKLEEQLKVFVDPVSEKADIENMVYELLLKSGKDLNSKIEKIDTYYIINENELVMILEKVSQKIIDKVIKSKPNKVIALDKLFEGNDQLKTNTVLQMKDVGIEFKTI